MKKLKTEFSINQIGKFRFYSGILIGIGYCIVLNLLFRFILRLSNLGFFVDEWNLQYEIPIYYYVLIAYSSIAFSFCLTTYMWMSKPIASIRRKTIRLRMAQVNPIWVFYGVLLFLARWFAFFIGLEITIKNDLSYLGFMFPIFIYLFCWHLISNIYKTKNTFIISTIIVIILGYLIRWL